MIDEQQKTMFLLKNQSKKFDDLVLKLKNRVDKIFIQKNMQKSSFGFVKGGLVVFLMTFLSGIAFAQELATYPDFVITDFSVINISKENSDAVQVGARAGDVLRYEVAVGSQTTDIAGLVPQVEAGEVLQAGDIIDSGLGVAKGNVLEFPAYSAAAPCEKAYTFFVRLKEDCGGLESVSATFAGKTLKVPVACKLTKVGPSTNVMIFGGLVVVLFLGSFMFRRVRA